MSSFKSLVGGQRKSLADAAVCASDRALNSGAINNDLLLRRGMTQIASVFRQIL